MISESPRRRRPFGVYVIIALVLLRVTVIALDLVAVQLGRPLMVLPEAEDPLVLATAGGATIALLLSISLGLFMLKRWAWIATMILIGFNLVVAIFQYLNGDGAFFAMFMDVISVFYLNQRNVQAAFEGRLVPPEVTA
jgi:lysylphosphatidylglycerol synthetase-like protein (DUF2156 family)